MARGRCVTLPVANKQVTVTITDKVDVSLRTKEATVAKDRFPLALNALDGCFDSLGKPP